MFKNIRIKMKGGKSRLQRVKVLASGKYRFVKNIGRKSSPSTRSKPSRRRKGGNVVRRRRRRGGKSFTQQAFKWIRLGALAAPAIAEFAIGQDTPQGKIIHTIRRYTGYDFYNREWQWQNLIQGYGPYLGAVLATYGIPKLVSMIRRL